VFCRRDPPAILREILLWLSEKVKFGQSTVLVVVDDMRMPLAGTATIDDGSTLNVVPGGRPRRRWRTGSVR